MGDRKQISEEMVEEAVQAEPKKVDLSAKVKLEKPALEDEDAPDLTIHVNSKMETVFLCERLTEEAFSTMLENSLSSLFSFTSHGNGWMLREINGLYVKLVSYIPIRGSFYLALLSELHSMNCLLNIRNRDDNICFLFCYVAAWHFVYAQSMYEFLGWRMRTNPEICSPFDPLTHQPVGDFEMPMDFNQNQGLKT